MSAISLAPQFKKNCVLLSKNNHVHERQLLQVEMQAWSAMIFSIGKELVGKRQQLLCMQVEMCDLLWIEIKKHEEANVLQQTVTIM